MKTKKILLIGLLFASLTSNAQTMNHRWSVGVNSGLTDYHGDLDHTWFDFNKGYKANVGLSGMYALNAWLNVGLMANYGSIGYHLPVINAGDQQGLRANLFHANGQLRLKFNNGVWLKEECKFQPYIYLGTGYAHMAANKGADNQTLVKVGSDWTGNLGAGLTYMFTEKLGLNYNLNYAMTNHDRRDGLSIGKNDQFMQHTLGVLFVFGKGKDMVDADNDGVADDKDKCLGTPANVKVDSKGCPKDGDNDGVADYLDACPDEPGITENKGCPAIKEDSKAILNQAIDGVQFETGKDVILASSYVKLDAVAALMKANNSYKLKIEGHTDNTGDSASNMELSKLRAAAVKAYLVNKGIDANRMQAEGFGETKPKASNDTPEGRAQNRRVEFEIYF